MRPGADGRSPVATVVCTASALVAFAANSVLCRLAPGRSAIDAASFSTLRLASGIGYVLWYAALSDLSATRPATVQLPVPVPAAAGGVLFLSEAVSLRLALSATLILGGVALALAAREDRVGSRSG